MNFKDVFILVGFFVGLWFFSDILGVVGIDIGSKGDFVFLVNLREVVLI